MSLPNIDIERSTVTHVKHGQYFIRNGAVYMRVDFVKGNSYKCFNYALYKNVYLGANATVYILPSHFNVEEKKLALDIPHKTLAN